MLSWLRNKPRPEQGLSGQLAELESLAEGASSGYETQYWIRAGDLCVRSGDGPRALVYFGRALDMYLDTGRLGAADTLCRRMLAALPSAVRVRCTLMWLTAARGSVAEVRGAIEGYVRAGVARDQVPMVLHQLRLLAATNLASEIREALAEALLELGADRDADRLFGEVFSERNGRVSPAPALSEQEWGERMLAATLLRPDELIGQLGIAA